MLHLTVDQKLKTVAVEYVDSVDYFSQSETKRGAIQRSCVSLDECAHTHARILL